MIKLGPLSTVLHTVQFMNMLILYIVKVNLLAGAVALILIRRVLSLLWGNVFSA